MIPHLAIILARGASFTFDISLSVENDELAVDDEQQVGKSPQPQPQQTSTVGFDPADSGAVVSENEEFGAGRGHTGVARAGAATKAESFVRGEGQFFLQISFRDVCDTINEILGI